MKRARRLASLEVDHGARGARWRARQGGEESDEQDGGAKERGGPLWRRVIFDLFDQFKDDLLLIVVGTGFAIARAMGVTIQSGQTGLLFTFGRAREELQPGFRFLIPFIQKVKRMPTRSRTMDLGAQRVANFDGLVYLCDANVVYRIVDIRKALIEVDELEPAMFQMLALGVQEVLREASPEDIRTSDRLDRRLSENLERRLEPWGVTVESAGFPSITPSPRSLRITQLQETVEERRRQLALLAPSTGLSGAAGLVGTRRFPRNRWRAMRRFTRIRRRSLRIRKRVEVLGWNGAQIKRAERAIFARLSWVRRAMPFGH